MDEKLLEQAGTSPKEGEEQVTPTETEAEPKEIQTFRAFATQEDYDREAGKIRGSAERAAKAALMQQLGIKVGDETTLAKVKAAYDASLTDAERTNNTIQTLQADVIAKDAIIASKDLEIAALTALVEQAGGDKNRAGKIMKMAKGLMDDETTIEDAILQVMELAGTGKKGEEEEPKGNGMPKGRELNRPEGKGNGQVNPFAKETFNMTRQAQLIREDPDLAQRMAKAAGKDISRAVATEKQRRLGGY